MAKGGKGRKGGGGGGGKTRKYSRDNNGRFASTGTGATARGGRLKTASGNKRKTQTAKITGSKTASTIKGKLKRDPAAASKIAQRKAAAKPPKAKGRIRATKREPLAPNSQLANKISSLKGDKEFMKKVLPSQQALAKQATSRTEKLRLQNAANDTKQNIAGRTRSITKLEARPIAGKRVTGRGDGPVTGPRAKRPNAIRGKVKRDTSLKPGPTTNAQRYPNIYRDSANTKGKAAAKAAAAAAKPKAKNKRTPDEAKVKRMAERFQAKGAAPESSSKVKRLNTIETRQRAMAFLAKPNSKGADRVGAVAQNIAKRKTYSTLTPNRNKPMARNSLGQKTIREQERKAAQGVATTRMQDTKKATQRVASPEPTTPRAKAASAQRIENSRSARKSANAAKAAANEVKYFRKDSDSQAYKNALAKRDRTLALRSPGTNKIAFRSRRMAIAAQRQRTNNVVEQTNISLDRSRGQGLRRTSTGMTQLGLMGPGKKLFRVRRITGIKRPSGSKLAKRLMR